MQVGAGIVAWITKSLRRRGSAIGTQAVRSCSASGGSRWCAGLGVRAAIGACGAAVLLVSVTILPGLLRIPAQACTREVS